MVYAFEAAAIIEDWQQQFVSKDFFVFSSIVDGFNVDLDTRILTPDVQCRLPSRVFVVEWKILSSVEAQQKIANAIEI